MALLPTELIWLEEATPVIWDYSDTRLQMGGRKRTEGAFRAFSVALLLHSPPVIFLTEWKDLRHAVTTTNYAAISHVWNESDDTTRIAREKQRPLQIKTGADKLPHTISWYGLVEAANAATVLGCQHLWLDFLCVDQLSPRDEDDRDKEMQIDNMGNIYQYAQAVICMVGGVSAVQAADKETAWMDRAWTLQEATINYTKTWAYLQWPGDPFFLFEDIKGVGNDKYLIKLDTLLNLGLDPLPTAFKVVCLDGKGNTYRGRIAAKNAMLSVVRGKTPQLRNAGIWRAMLLRTSTKPVDIVYSVMGLFNIKLNPYSEDYDLQYLFNDLARKVAAVGSPKGYGMEWLCIGGVLGSVGRLQRDDSSLLIPKVPYYTKAQDTPWYFVGDQGKWSGDLVDDSRIAITQYHITFVTDSQPHIICAPMLKVENIRHIPPAEGTTVKDALIDLGRMKGLHCKYHGEIYAGDIIMAVMIGTVGSWDWNLLGSRLAGRQFVMFMKWVDGWKLVGDGAVPFQEDLVKKLPRSHFTMGIDSQRADKSWPCDHIPKLSVRPLRRSYGVLPLNNYGTQNDQRWEVFWFGFVGQRPPVTEWKIFKIFLEEQPPMIRTQHFVQQSSEPLSEPLSELSQPLRQPLWLVSSSLERPPRNILMDRSSRLLGLVKLDLELTDVSLGNAWSAAVEEALSKGYQDARAYSVEVRFAKHMIYLRSVPDHQREEKNPQFIKTAVSSYYPNLQQALVLNPYVEPYNN